MSSGIVCHERVSDSIKNETMTIGKAAIVFRDCSDTVEYERDTETLVYTKTDELAGEGNYNIEQDNIVQQSYYISSLQLSELAQQYSFDVELAGGQFRRTEGTEIYGTFSDRRNNLEFSCSSVASDKMAGESEYSSADGEEEEEEEEVVPKKMGCLVKQPPKSRCRRYTETSLDDVSSSSSRTTSVCPVVVMSPMTSLPSSGIMTSSSEAREGCLLLPQVPRAGSVPVRPDNGRMATPAVSRNIGRILELALLLLALIFATPTAGRYDRGGPQHSITWGRSNAHNSAVFGNLPTNITAVLGHRARLPCQVKNLGLKDVSWIRKRDLHILTVGIFTYTADERFKVFHHLDTEDWFLEISSVTFRDAGVYECQVSTSPKVSLPIHLTILAVQQAEILGPTEVYIQHGSTISLQCEIEAGVEAVGPVHWYRGALTLNYSSPRGGISMEVEKTPTRTMSKLYITRAVRPDSGNYTCAPKFARPDSVIVHVVNAGEESAAAVQSSVKGSRACVGVVWAAAFLTSWLIPAHPPPTSLLLP